MCSHGVLYGVSNYLKWSLLFILTTPFLIFSMVARFEPEVILLQDNFMVYFLDPLERIRCHYLKYGGTSISLNYHQAFSLYGNHT